MSNMDEKELLCFLAGELEMRARVLAFGTRIKVFTRTYMPFPEDLQNFPTISVYLTFKENREEYGWNVRFIIHELVEVQESLDLGKPVLRETARKLVKVRLKSAIKEMIKCKTEKETRKTP